MYKLNYTAKIYFFEASEFRLPTHYMLHHVNKKSYSIKHSNG